MRMYVPKPEILAGDYALRMSRPSWIFGTAVL
jgi:hypothetical protein